MTFLNWVAAHSKSIERGRAITVLGKRLPVRGRYGAAAAIEKLQSSGAELGGATPSWRLLSSEEAEAYRREVQANKGGKGGGKGKGEGGRRAPRGWGSGMTTG